MDLNLGDTQLIISECQKQDLLRNQAAYVLATTFWETARTMRPVREYGSEAYLRSKRYYPFVGMGYVQLTWEANYKRASDELGVDFVADPMLLLKPGHAVKILVTGMLEGWFTGRKLADYIILQRSDFIGARKIVNGTDQDEGIAEIAREYDRVLEQVGYGVEPVEVKPVPEKKPSQPDQHKPAAGAPSLPARPDSSTIWQKILAAILQLFR